MTPHRRRVNFPPRWNNTENPIGERSHKYWQRRSNGIFENPYVRVDYTGPQVKVTVKHGYFHCTYSDPYVHVEVGNPPPQP
jgi:hypothetical protein